MGLYNGARRGLVAPQGRTWHSAAWAVAFRRSDEDFQDAVASGEPSVPRPRTAEPRQEPAPGVPTVPRQAPGASPSDTFDERDHGLLHHLGQVAGARTSDEALDALATAVVAFSGATTVQSWLLDPSQTRLLSHSPASGPEPTSATVLVGSGLVGLSAAEGSVLRGRTTGSRRSSAGAAPDLANVPDASIVTVSHLVLPLTAAGRRVGVVDVGWEQEPDRLDDHTEAALARLAAVAAVQIDLLRMRESGAAALDRDPDSGLLHRARLQRDLAQECARTMRYGHPVALVVFAVSGGAPAAGGDSPFEIAADLVHAHVRAADAVYRFGEDTIAVLAPQTGPDGAFVLAERLAGVLQRTLVSPPADDDEDVSLRERTVSIRTVWVSVPADGSDAEHVLRAVETRLSTEANSSTED